MATPQSGCLHLTVHAGPHSRKHTVVSAKVTREVYEQLEPARRAVLKDADTGKTFPCQLDHSDRGRISFIIRELDRGETMRLVSAPGSPRKAAGVDLLESQDTVRVLVGGKLFTVYHFRGRSLARQYFYPVLGPGDCKVTRECRFEDSPGFDHKHHKSIWVAHGLVNGADNWSEEPGHGFTRHVEFEQIASGPVFGRIVEVNEWLNAAEQKVLGERRVMCIYNQPPDSRCMDIEITFRAGHDAVLFGDTKEGGLISVRVTPSMNAPAGTITNAFSGINEDETWGKRAQWCDYSGKADGRHVGIAIFDHPQNPLHPTYWHVRNYGLMTANPFGVSYFESGSGKRGDWLLQAQEEATFRYRIYIHRGSAEAANVADRYHDYANPPEVEFQGQ